MAENIKPGKADILYIYRKLAASLARIKGFDGCMIAKAEFKTGEAGNTNNMPGVNNKFIRQRMDYSVISASTIYNNTEYVLVMHIIRPGSISVANTCKKRIQEAGCQDYFYLFTLEYTRENIKRYVEYTGDSNPIHQQVRPVVPGFLMLEDIITKELYKNIIDNNTDGYIISFRSPVYAGVPIEIYKINDGTGKIIALQAGSQPASNIYASYKWELYPVQRNSEKR